LKTPIKNTIQAEFYVSSLDNRVDEYSDIWNEFLPSNRHYQDNTVNNLTFCDYFKVTEDFVFSKKFKICEYVSHTFLQNKPIDSIKIIIKKHGEFYHPAKIDFYSDSLYFSAVINVAVSDAGKYCIQSEINALKRIDLKTESVPHIFSYGEIKAGNDAIIVAFVAEWFENYHEFHLSYDKNDSNKKKIIVWDYDNGNYFLTDSESKALYYKASEIMTDCFNPVSSEQIMPWHHAAGDFVIKKNEKGIDVKLITVRQYTSFIDDPEVDNNPDLEMTLFFLVNLSIRMRLDRIDGIKDIAWSNDSAVSDIIDGFLFSLEKKGKLGNFDISYCEIFKYYLKKIELDEIIQIITIISDSYNSGSPDVKLINENKRSHGQLIYNSIMLL
jgi:hypothetical protein